jgi:hypothetical protein
VITGLRAIADTESAQVVGDVSFDGRLRDRQLRGDLAIALALSQELEDLQLASAQRHTCPKERPRFGIGLQRFGDVDR